MTRLDNDRDAAAPLIGSSESAPRRAETSVATSFVLNAGLHCLHLAVIGFSVLGWISPATRPAHLVLAALIAFSWFVLGPLMGRGLGFCAVTGVQHALWKRSDRETPNYMVFLAELLLRRHVDEARVGLVTQLVFYGTTAVSLALWWMERGVS